MGGSGEDFSCGTCPQITQTTTQGTLLKANPNSLGVGPALQGAPGLPQEHSSHVPVKSQITNLLFSSPEGNGHPPRILATSVLMV